MISRRFRSALLAALTASSPSFFGCSSSDDPHAANSAGAGAQNAGTGNCGVVVSNEQAGGAGGSSGAGETESGEACPEPHVFSIKFDYRFDRAGYFDAPERRAALEAAAAAWSARLTSDFPSVPSGTKLTLVDPEDREQQVTIDSLEEDIDDLLVFVGTSEAIAGSGQGGPAGFAETSDPELQQALIERQIGKPFQPWAGSISFNGSIEYFFDESPETRDDLPEEQQDFISVATHELGHVLGFATCPAFIALEKEGTFLGKAAFDAYGGPVPLEPDFGHFAAGSESDGVEALMTPPVLHGARREPTTLDLATLVDIGYVTR